MAETALTRKNRGLGPVLTLLICLFAAGPVIAAPAKAPSHAYKDWIAVCDNVKTCTAVGLTPEDDLDFVAALYVERDAGPAAAPRVMIKLGGQEGEGAKPTTWRIMVDSKLTATVATVKNAHSARLNEADSRAVMAGIATGSRIDVVANGGVVGMVSLTGSSAALRWIDDQQGRVGGATALVAKGAKPASAVPVAPPLPTPQVRPAASQANLPKTPPASLAAKVKDCGPYDTRKIAVHRVDADVLMWLLPCGDGAYNMVDELYFTSNAGALLPKVRASVDENIMNIGYDAKTQTLEQYGKGRGPGDCGDVSSWVWTGQAFAKVSEQRMDVCRGILVDDWPVTWRAKVVPAR